MYRDFVKPVLDFIVAFIGLMVLSPVFLVVTLVLFIVNKGSPFFLQERPGKNEKIFRVIKFKSMNDKKDIKGKLLPDAERLTSFGAFVRKTSLDEIPQLINVLIGEMSLIGPRPLLVKYLPLYTKEQRERHTVRPGITGWAQIQGRNLMMLSKKFEYDVWYVNNLSFTLDLKIILKTFRNIVTRENVSGGSENMEKVDDLNFRNRYTE